MTEKFNFKILKFHYFININHFINYLLIHLKVNPLKLMGNLNPMLKNLLKIFFQFHNQVKFI